MSADLTDVAVHGLVVGNAGSLRSSGPVMGLVSNVVLPAAAHQAPPIYRDFGSALSHCALGWHQQPDEPATLEAITRDARTLLPGGEVAAVVTVSESGHLRIRCACGPIAMLLAALPGTRRFPVWPPPARPQVLTAPDARWPISAILEGIPGAGNIICAPLGSGQMMFGTLLILRTTGRSYTPREAHDATTLAIHASIALAAVRGRDHLRAAVNSRDVIGQAKGILMQREHLTAEQAFGELLRTSQHTNIKLHQIAETLCLTGELPAPRGKSPDELPDYTPGGVTS